MTHWVQRFIMVPLTLAVVYKKWCYMVWNRIELIIRMNCSFTAPVLGFSIQIRWETWKKTLPKYISALKIYILLFFFKRAYQREIAISERTKTDVSLFWNNQILLNSRQKKVLQIHILASLAGLTLLVTIGSISLRSLCASIIKSAFSVRILWNLKRI